LSADCLDRARQPVVGIGIGFGGPVDVASGTVRRSHHAPGWAGMELRTLFAERFKLPVVLENDANAAGLGEALFGAGRAADSLLYVNVGTGVGGAVIIKGRIHRGAHSSAGEIGHVVVKPDGPTCTCGKRGCVEALASGDAIGRRARERMAADASAATVLRKVPPAELTGCVVGMAAARGDALARQLMTEAATWLGMAIAGAANVIDPEVVVIGGGVAETGEPFLVPLQEAFKRYAVAPLSASTPVVAAELGYNAGVVGAAAVAFVELGIVKPNSSM